MIREVKNVEVWCDCRCCWCVIRCFVLSYHHGGGNIIERDKMGMVLGWHRDSHTQVVETIRVMVMFGEL